MGLIAGRYSGTAWGILLGGAAIVAFAGSAASSCALPGYSIDDEGGAEETTASSTAAGTGGEMASSVGAGGAGGEGAGTGGTGGVDDEKSCSSDAECAKASGPCRTGKCVNAQCEFTNKGTPDLNSPGVFQLLGCVSAACKEGKVIFEADPTKVHMDQNECTVDACEGPYVDHSPASLGKPCSTSMGGGVCNASAQCVECVANQTCQPEGECVEGRCIEPVCGAQCGNTCEPCPVGKVCLSGHDCLSGACKSGMCVAPSCPDGAQNQSETDVDCGGPPMECAARCGIGKRCASNDDCTSGLCKGGVCQFTCADNTKNGMETGEDCGGPTCPDCSVSAP